MNNLSWHTRGADDPVTQECTCPFCNLRIAGRIQHIIVFSGWLPGMGNIHEDKYYVLQCPSCGRPLVYDISEQKTFPFAKAMNPVKHLPEKVERVYNEVRSAIGAGCYTAAVILARTAINHIAVDKGAEENRSFQYYVNYLVNSHFVPPNAHGWVDRIRQIANESVHDLEVWERDDAEIIGKFLMYLLIFVYELPASIE